MRIRREESFPTKLSVNVGRERKLGRNAVALQRRMG